jgi:hypothetical protein
MTINLGFILDSVHPPVGYNSHNSLLVAELDLRVGKYVVAYPNALRIGREDVRADFGHSLLKDTLRKKEYLIPIVGKYDPINHRNALRVIELDTNTVITHTHCGAEKNVQRKPLERITQEEIDQKIGNEWVWVDKIF